MAAWFLLLFVNCSPVVSEAVEAPAHRSLDVRFLGGAAPGAGPVNPTLDSVTSGSRDAYFEPIPESRTRADGGAYWLKIQSLEAPSLPPSAIPAIVVHASRQAHVELFAAR